MLGRHGMALYPQSRDLTSRISPLRAGPKLQLLFCSALQHRAIVRAAVRHMPCTREQERCLADVYRLRCRLGARRESRAAPDTDMRLERPMLRLALVEAL